MGNEIKKFKINRNEVDIIEIKFNSWLLNCEGDECLKHFICVQNRMKEKLVSGFVNDIKKVLIELKKYYPGKNFCFIYKERAYEHVDFSKIRFYVEKNLFVGQLVIIKNLKPFLFRREGERREGEIRADLEGEIGEPGFE